MDDSAHPHRYAEALNTLESEDINCMQWHVYSMDRNPINHVCDALCRFVSQTTRPLRTVQELKIALREDLENISQELPESLVGSLNNRCKMCVSVRRNHKSC